MYGELDEAYGREHAERVSKAYPNVELVEVKNVGHYIPYFAWDDYYRTVTAYLKSIQ
jgi:hypothetical protein